jgi:phosphotransferase system  glucose/maltose/N-acetylglucosamine-specific IIC component
MLTWLRKNTKTIMIVVAVLFIASMFYGLGYRGIW